jgi:hypothetical protein
VFDEMIVGKFNKDFEPTKRYKLVPSSFDFEEENVICNQVLICIVGEWFILLKDNWHLWQPEFDKTEFKSFTINQRKRLEEMYE